MSLSSELISQFVKATQPKKDVNAESTIQGTVWSISNGTVFVHPDEASEWNTMIPTTSTVGCEVGNRVIVSIKDHTAIVTGNITVPSASSIDVPEGGMTVTEVQALLADKVTTGQLVVQIGRIDNLEAEDAKIRGELAVAEATITNVKADNLDVKTRLNAVEADISYLEVQKLDVEVAEVEYAKAADLEATDAQIYNLEGVYAEFQETTAEKFEATDASIKELDTKKLDSEYAKVTYANIDFSNIGKAAMEYFYAASGLIESVIVGDGTITGKLVGVTISGDILEGNTVVADKLVIKGSDGLYYKLNTDGVTTEAEQTDYNSLNGQVIKAKSITADKVSVSDLVAFDATIGGFNITTDSIYSEVKDDEGNTARGIYMDTDGQFNFGDETNFVKYYRDDDGNYKLVISAESIMYALNGKQYSIADLGLIGEYIHIGTYEGEPCIELGESDSDFKLLITNTRIMFKEGTGIPAYFNNQSMHIEKAVVEEELQQGGFMWKVRSNGNLGLVWKGVTS
jgi:hypothetical protein